MPLHTALAPAPENLMHRPIIDQVQQPDSLQHPGIHVQEAQH